MGLKLLDLIKSISEIAWVKVIDAKTEEPITMHKGFYRCWKYEEFLDNGGYLEEKAKHGVILIKPSLTIENEPAIIVSID